MNADGSCHIDDPHCSEMEAIQSLHKKLDDDANGNIDISESTDVSSTPVGLSSTIDLMPILPPVPPARAQVRLGIRESSPGFSLQRRHAHFSSRIVGGMAPLGGAQLDSGADYRVAGPERAIAAVRGAV